MSERASLWTPVLFASCLILLIGFGVRATFGVFQIPIATEFGWPRAEFSLAIAIQNLAWGIGQPIFSAIAERIGDRKAIVMGTILYALGMLLSAMATSPLAHQALNILIGFGVAGTGFGVILAVVGRAAAEENRSMALAVAAAAGSAGQVVGPPIAQTLLVALDWQSTFMIFAAALLLMLALLPLLKGPDAPQTNPTQGSMGAVIGRAFRDPSYIFLFLGFFSCGYHVGFFTAHFPAFVTELCGPISPGGILAGMGVSTTSALGALSISIIGLANVGGTLLAGQLGKRYRMKNLLAGIYLGRTIVATVFILMPITPFSVIMFSVAMGSLWLATVPLTSGLVARLYGVKYMGTLYGIVFLSHQIGSFLGIWLGGRLYDVFGTYAHVWWVGIAIGAFSTLIHLAIRETGPAPAPA